MVLAAPAVPHLTIGQVAARFPGVTTWHVRRTIKRGYLPEPARFGGFFRAFAESDLPAVRKALEKAGYLKRQEAAK